MPRVPNLNELRIEQRGIDTGGFTAVQARMADMPQYSGPGAHARGFDNLGDLSGRGVAPSPYRPQDNIYAQARLALENGQGLIGDSLNLAATLDGLHAEMKRKADAVRVMDAKNALDAAYLDEANNPQTGWRQQKGRHALEPDKDGKSLLQRYDESARKRYGHIYAGLHNDEQRAAFAAYADEKRAQQQADIQAHSSREYTSYQLATYKSRINNLQNAITTGDSADIERAVTEMRTANAQYAADNGLPPEWLEEANREAASGAIAQAAQQRIKDGNMDEAALMMAQYGDTMSGEDMAKTTAAWQGADSIRAATAQAEADWQAGNNDFQYARPGDYYAKYNQGFSLDYARKKLFAAESGGRADAKNTETTASGIAQFIEGTWDQFGKSAIGREIRGALALGSRAWYNLRNDPRIATIATEWYFAENRKVLTKAGVPWNNMTAYLAHFAGPQGAIALYQADPGISAAQALRQGGVKNWREKVRKNPTILGGTAEHAIDVVAGKMGVKPDTSLPTGRPGRREILSETQIRRRALNYAPDDPLAQHAYAETLKLHNAEYAEQEQAAHGKAYMEEYIRIHSGGSMADADPNNIALLNPKEIVSLTENAEQIENRARNRQYAEARFEVLKLSRDPQRLMQMKQEDIYQMRGDIGEENMKTLLTAWDNIQKDKGLEKTYKLRDGLLDSLMDKVYDYGYSRAKKGSKEAVMKENIRYYAEGEWLRILNAMVESGEEITEEKLMQRLEDSLRLQTEVEEKGWTGSRTVMRNVAQLPPWQQVQYFARQQLQLKVAGGQAIDSENFDYRYTGFDKQHQADFSGGDNTDLLRSRQARVPRTEEQEKREKIEEDFSRAINSEYFYW